MFIQDCCISFEKKTAINVSPVEKIKKIVITKNKIIQ